MKICDFCDIITLWVGGWDLFENLQRLGGRIVLCETLQGVDFFVLQNFQASQRFPAMMQGGLAQKILQGGAVPFWGWGENGVYVLITYLNFPTFLNHQDPKQNRK